MKVGFVVASHPEDHSVDLVMVEDGAHLAGVQVSSSAASSRTGMNDLPDPGASSSGDKWAIADHRAGQDLVALVDYVGRVPIVTGFLFPQVCQMLFNRMNFRVERHASDWYTTVDANGNFEAAHPSGSFVRLAESPDHEDLTGQDFDKKWKIDRNTTRAPWLSLMVKNGGTEVMRLRCDPSGNVSAHHVGTLTTQTDGNASVTVGGNTSIAVGGTTSITSTGNTSITTPQLTLNGKLVVAGDVSTTGALTNNGVNVGSTHTHPDPQGARTGPPG